MPSNVSKDDDAMQRSAAFCEAADAPSTSADADDTKFVISPECRVKELWWDPGRKPAQPVRTVIVDRPEEFDRVYATCLDPNLVGCVFGLDCEWTSLKNYQFGSERWPRRWPPLEGITHPQLSATIENDFVSLLQLSNCFGVAVLLRVCFFDQLPGKLVYLLKSPEILKVGVNISHDAQRLRQSFQISVNGVLDLRSFVAQHPHFELPSRHKRGLKDIADRLFNVAINTRERAGNWNYPGSLNTLQVKYAAFDSQSAIDAFMHVAPYVLGIFDANSIRPALPLFREAHLQHLKNGKSAFLSPSEKESLQQGYGLAFSYKYDLPDELTNLGKRRAATIDLCTEIVLRQLQVPRDSLVFDGAVKETAASRYERRLKKIRDSVRRGDESSSVSSDDWDEEEDPYVSISCFRDSCFPDLMMEFAIQRRGIADRIESMRRVWPQKTDGDFAADNPDWMLDLEYLEKTRDFDFGKRSYYEWCLIYDAVYQTDYAESATKPDLDDSLVASSTDEQQSSIGDGWGSPLSTDAFSDAASFVQPYHQASASNNSHPRSFPTDRQSTRQPSALFRQPNFNVAKDQSAEELVQIDVKIRDNSVTVSTLSVEVEEHLQIEVKGSSATYTAVSANGAIVEESAQASTAAEPPKRVRKAPPVCKTKCFLSAIEGIQKGNKPPTSRKVPSTANAESSK